MYFPFQIRQFVAMMPRAGSPLGLGRRALIETSAGRWAQGLAAGESMLVSSLIGHNRGPPLDPEAGWRAFCWRKAHAKAWKTPPREIALARLTRAEALGISYREYTAILLDRGIHL